MVKFQKLLIGPCLYLLAYGVSFAEETISAVPSWFSDDVQYSSRSGGRWLTDNAQYKSAQEQWDSYVIHWQAGPANHSMSGRMWALKDNAPSNGDFWAFSQYWNPATGEAVVQQSGWGSVGIGRLQPASSKQRDADFEMLQLFTTFDGNSSETGHRVKRVDDDTYDTWSFSFDKNGKEVEGRYYRWRRDSEMAE